MKELIVFKNRGYLRKVKQLLPILDEVAPSMKKEKCMNYDLLKKRIKKEFGYKVLGIGFTAICFEIERNVVLRIEYNYRKNAMFRWLEYAQHNPSALTPRIFFRGVAQVNSKNNFFISIVDKLQPLEKTKIFKNRNEAIVNPFYFLAKFLLNKNNDLYYWESFQACFKTSVVPNQFLSLKDILRLKADVRNINDVHEGNIMFCERRQKLILSDRFLNMNKIYSH